MDSEIEDEAEDDRRALIHLNYGFGGVSIVNLYSQYAQFGYAIEIPSFTNVPLSLYIFVGIYPVHMPW